MSTVTRACSLKFVLLCVAAIACCSEGAPSDRRPSVVESPLAMFSRTPTEPRNQETIESPSKADEYHPAVRIGPPLTGLLRTAIRPSGDAIGGAGSSGPNWLPAGFTNSPQQLQPWPGFSAPLAPVPGESPAETVQSRISARYRDPRLLGYLSRTSYSEVLALFAESSQLIDQRHVSPLSYEERTQRALEGLSEAVVNAEFLAAGRASANASAAQQLSYELQQLARSQPARSLQDATAMLEWAAELSQQRIGLRREAAAVEFLNAMLDSLDKYSAFLPAKSYSAPRAGLDEQIVGIGVELKAHDDGVLVTGIVENGPAARGGVQKGDVVIAVDGRSLRGLGLSAAADMIGGPSGSTVTLQVARQGQTVQISLRRQSVYVSSVVDAQFLDSARKVGYLRLEHFSESSSEDLVKTLWRLYNAGMDALVLDVRGNPGGLLSESVDVSSVFLPTGRIVSTRGRTSADNSDFKASGRQAWKIPLVVLIDEHSASAAEIFAAAIQENRRGVVLGRRSYGKGTVQTHFPLQTAAGELKLTTAKFYSPTGREMAGAGVTPDYTIPATPEGVVVDLSQDEALQAALEVIDSGAPAQLAASQVRTKQPAGRGLGSR